MRKTGLPSRIGRILKERSLYPWLFSLFPALELYSRNIKETAPVTLLIPLGLSLFLAMLVWLAARAVSRRSCKASLSTLLFCLMFFSYGHLSVMMGLPHWTVYPWGAAFLVAAFLVLRTHRDLSGWTPCLNIFAAVLVVSVAGQIAWSLTRLSGHPPSLTQLDEDARLSGRKLSPAMMPDIYYLILDRYANEKILKSEFGFDNSGFLNSLRARGFFVADDSRCNYPQTSMSLASSLNMDYIDLAQGEEAAGPGHFFMLLKNSRVLRLMRSLGYTSINLGTWFEGTAFNPYADLNLGGTGIHRYWNDFFQKFVGTTALRPWSSGRFFRPRQRDRILQQFAELERMPARRGPKFVFAHFLVTHPPYVFGPNGEEQGPEEAFTYINQLRFANARLSRLIDALQKGSSLPPVIILQSDEGPRSGGGDVRFLQKERRVPRRDETESPEQKLVHHPILNALAFPGADTRVLYPSMSPVNTFRMFFNLYFGSQYRLLPDETRAPSWRKHFQRSGAIERPRNRHR
jgi:hypothetical protein